MAGRNQNITVDEGTHHTFGFDVSSLGDLTECELVWKLAHNVESNPIIVFKLSEGDIEIDDGVALIHLEPEHTLEKELKVNNYHELKFIDSNGQVDIKSSGRLSVRPTLAGK